MGQLFFDEESIYEISKPYLKICMDRQTSPKQYAPITFSKVGGINMEYSKYEYELLSICPITCFSGVKLQNDIMKLY